VGGIGFRGDCIERHGVNYNPAFDKVYKGKYQRAKSSVRLPLIALTRSTETSSCFFPVERIRVEGSGDMGGQYGDWGIGRWDCGG
jgi:hypothetical protein